MKKILLPLALALSLLLLVSCGKESANDDIPETTDAATTAAAPVSEADTEDTEAVTAADTVADTVSADTTAKPELADGVYLYDASSYKIIRGDNCSSGEKAVAVELNKRLKNLFGSFKIGTDYDEATELEIIIGSTKRAGYENTCDSLGYGDYYVTYDEKKNIIIAAGSDEALETAVEYFLDNCVDYKNNAFVMPKEEYRHREEVLFETLTIDGVNVSEFKIFNKTASKKFDDFAAKFSSQVAGYKLEVENAKYTEPRAGTHYIILDGTGFIENEYSIKVEDGNLVIKGSYNTLSNAVDTFLGDFSHDIGQKTYNLTSADNKTYYTEKKTIPYTKDQLMQVMTDVYNSKNIIIGEEVQGTDAECIEGAIQRFYAATKQYPGIMGIDLACYGIDLMKTDDATWSARICDIVEYCSEGGIITASSHWENPSGNTKGSARCRGLLGYDDTQSGYEKAFEELLTEGTEYNKKWKAELTENARFLKALGDNDVTVLWRPLHESNGGWFWFCTTQNGKTLPASYLQRMWIYMYEYFVDELGLTNLIWNYGPNTSSNVSDNPGTTMSPWYCYPGDEYVDMVGIDWYTSGNFEITTNNNYLTLLEKTGKIGAITEFGPTGSLLASGSTSQEELFTCMDLYNTLLGLEREDCRFVYLLTWGSVWGIPAMGKGEEFMNTDITLGRADVKAMFDELGG